MHTIMHAWLYMHICMPPNANLIQTYKFILICLQTYIYDLSIPEFLVLLEFPDFYIYEIPYFCTYVSVT